MYETFANVLFNLINGHWEIGMTVIVVQDITYRLVDHAKERSEGSEPCEIHDVLQCGRVVKTFLDQTI